MTTSLLMSKIIDISDARRRRTPCAMASEQSTEKRRDFRRKSQVRSFVQIVTCDDQHKIGTTVSCQAVDVSANGLRIISGYPIPAGACIDLWVDNDAGPGKFFLSGNVHWSSLSGDGWYAGIELQAGSATDIHEWQRMMGYPS